MAAAAAALLRIYRVAPRMFSEKPALRCDALHTAVWRDVLDCKPPKGCDPSSVAGDITGTLVKLNHDGPITFFAFADWDSRVEPQVEEALSGTGMKFRQMAIYHNGNRIKYSNCIRSESISMVMNSALLRTTPSFSDRRITSRGFATKNMKNKDLGKGGISAHANESKVNIWWDIQRCQLPVYFKAGTVIKNIRNALRRINCFGPVDIWAYGDMKRLPPETLSDLHNSGVRLRHDPRGRVMEKDHVMIADMIAWTMNHPPPAIHMFMSDWGDHHTYFFCQWRMVVDGLRGYDILFVLPKDWEIYPDEYYECPRIAGAKGLWLWETLLAGTDPLDVQPKSTITDKAAMASSYSNDDFDDAVDKYYYEHFQSVNDYILDG